MKTIDYTVRVDEHIITTIHHLPIIMTVSRRDQIQHDIAVTYNIPKHYISLYPVTVGSGMK